MLNTVVFICTISSQTSNTLLPFEGKPAADSILMSSGGPPLGSLPNHAAAYFCVVNSPAGSVKVPVKNIHLSKEMARMGNTKLHVLLMAHPWCQESWAYDEYRYLMNRGCNLNSPIDQPICPFDVRGGSRTTQGSHASPTNQQKHQARPSDPKVEPPHDSTFP